MSLEQEVAEAITRARAAETDLQDVEIKSGVGGPPKSLQETVSAFANGDGGLIILGVDESQGFLPVPVNARQLADALATACSDQVEPSIRAEIDVTTFEGSQVAVAAVPALERARKPCFVKTQGLERGSYIRSHDGDRRLATYEVHALLSGKGQPKDDCALVEGASQADLIDRDVDAYVARLRDTRGQIFAEADTEQVLRMTGVLTPDGSGVTMSGLLALGRFPQQFLPQLNVTFVAFPTKDARPMEDGTRFLDNVPVDGPIPQMVEGTWTALSRNITRAAVVNGIGRDDRWEYPPRAVRELVANALMHRDYHPLAQGSQVRVELYPDRLAITSPGGLFGAVNTAVLQHSPITSTRNLTLARLLEDVAMPRSEHTVAENRGTGLLIVAGELERAGLPPLEIKTDLLSFTATIRRPAAPPAATGSPSEVPPLTRRQEEVLRLLDDGPSSTQALADALSISRRAVAQHLKALESAGRVRLTTESRRAPDAQWRVNERDNPDPRLTGRSARL
jgi:ATP-dependent DNA helicase RecG